MSNSPSLDVITIGRSSIDLYGSQVGGRLEDMGSFTKYIGGSPTNISVGCSRLGLRAGIITAVGDEHMGRFIKDQLSREGVDIGGIKTDSERLTALVILGIRDEDSFPLIFYREDCADMSLSVDDIDPSYISSSRCIVATGTHLSHPTTRAMTQRALELGRSNGSLTALDIDYRPNLWGLSGHDDGENRFIASSSVTSNLQSTLSLFDLIVGTQEEFHIAGGSQDTLTSLCNVRELTNAVLVCKLGSTGAVVFPSEIGSTLESGIMSSGYPVEVFNVLGAGDGFMSGLLKGWLDDEDWQTSLKYANACGAFAVSRHGCAPSYPSWEELQFFFSHRVQSGTLENPCLRLDKELEDLHWASCLRLKFKNLLIFDLSDNPNYYDSLLSRGYVTSHHGIVANDTTSRSALHRASDTDMWIGRRLSSIDNFSQFDQFDQFDQWPLRHCAFIDDGSIIDAAEIRRRMLSLAITTDTATPHSPDWLLAPEHSIGDVDKFVDFATTALSTHPRLQGIIVSLSFLSDSGSQVSFMSSILSLDLDFSVGFLYTPLQDEDSCLKNYDILNRHFMSHLEKD